MAIDGWVVKDSFARCKSNYEYLPVATIQGVLPRSQTHVERRDGFNFVKGQRLIQSPFREIGRRYNALVAWADENQVCVQVRIQKRDTGIESVEERKLQHGKDHCECDSRCGGEKPPLRIHELQPSDRKTSAFWPFTGLLGKERSSATLASTRQQVAVAEQAVSFAGDVLAHARRLYEAGLTNSIEVIDAQTELAIAKDEQVAALFDYTNARIELAEAMGTTTKLTF